MTDVSLSKDVILDTAESVFRKFGLAKTNISDIARALHVSHAALYKYFDNKAALRKAVVERWMHSVFDSLNAVAAEDIPADQKMYRWLDTLRKFKRERARKDPELFAMYAAMVAETEGALEVHVEHLIDQLTLIIEDGVLSGIFACKDPRQAATAVFIATTRFHHAAHSAEWESPHSDAQFQAIWQVLLNGLSITK
ncbi:hypothetical protein A8L34_12470 [Bacillus sp. FJAT-27264]|uniref:TetR family transcriptional regulator n=1 Tax=Paenibacillus sp. (strain DSM 101736 / FJAT-27264) TaxID=1850362 RepID=UPI000807AE8C|nr:TetR family transcriptional regulator [Bacillus sp. FJAT-27264]OBZ14720.1 hypothetical protein A8L34_12470 [Bacillus sp. FJAT-27264]